MYSVDDERKQHYTVQTVEVCGCGSPKRLRASVCLRCWMAAPEWVRSAINRERFASEPHRAAMREVIRLSESFRPKPPTES